MKYKNGEEFLDSLYKDMHMEDSVMHTAEKSDTPVQKIEKYMKRLERGHNHPRKIKLLKAFYYDKYVIKEVPESYINLQKRIARERGYGDIDVTDAMKQEYLSRIQSEQKSSLDMWIDYLTSDDVMYPMWFKHYAFRGMLKLGKFDKEKGEFGRRTRTTTEPYIEINSEALAQTYESLSKIIGSDVTEISEEQQKTLDNGESFKKLYTYYLLSVSEKRNVSGVEGKWIRYNQGSDYKPLWESLQGKNTGWCTAGEGTAKQQLSSGDFYVYYTKDVDGKYTEPRIAIRMDGKDEIAEVRGIGKNQNLEGSMTAIVEEKLSEFSNKDNYLKKVHDMKKLTEIDNKVNANQELTRDDLKFLYEIDYEIEGFGYEKDPRIQEIKRNRDVKKDFSLIFGVSEENIGTSIEDFEKNEIVCFLGDLSFTGEFVPKSFEHLKYISGSADFRNLTGASGLYNLQSIGEDADFRNLIDAFGLESLQNIGGHAFFDYLTNASGLKNLQNIGGDADFSHLTNASGLRNLQNIGRNARFYNLTNASGLESLQNIGGYASFDRLTDAYGLKNLQNIGLDAGFGELIAASDLENLRSIGGDADFHNLIDAYYLKNLQNIGGTADFRNLTDAFGLESLQNIGGHARFDNLADASGLESLQNIGGTADFRNLNDSSGLGNLQSIGKNDEFIDDFCLGDLQNVGGTADFRNLTDAYGLGNLQSIGGDAVFESLTNASGLESLQSISGDAVFESLTNASGLENLEFICGTANFGNLTDASGLESLEEMGGPANFGNLTDASGLKNLQTIWRDADFHSLADRDAQAKIKSITHGKTQFLVYYDEIDSMLDRSDAMKDGDVNYKKIA